MLHLIDEVFDAEGVLSLLFQSYKSRPGQITMAKTVMACLGDKKHAVIEAPTGTGKSLAAGIPAALHGAAEGSSVIYCTANKVLQEQLYFSDCAIIKKVLDVFTDEGVEENDRFQYGLIKGMNNYLCKFALGEAKTNRTVPEDVLNILQDLDETSDVFDRTLLQQDVGDDIWSKVSVGPETCLKDSCSVDKGDCHVYRARKSVKDCHMIVTNYHVLFIDAQIKLASNGEIGLLPEYSFIIMDEAHEVPQIAMDFRGFSISPASINSLKGFLSRASTSQAASISRRMESSFNLLQKKFSEVGRVFSILEEPIGDDFGACTALSDCFKYLRERLAEMRDMVGIDPKRMKRINQLIASCILLEDRVATVCFGRLEFEPGNSKALGKFPAEHVFYFEQRPGSEHYKVSCKVLDAAEWLQETVFSRNTVIATSATLSANKSKGLGFIANQLGLQEDQYEGLIVPSPFSGKRALAVVPEGEFDPDHEEFPAYLAKNLFSLIMNMRRGGILALFTSYRNLREVRRLLHICHPQLNVFTQGQDGRRQIIEKFKQAHDRGEKAIILATASFWQGVDIPGQALSVVFIDKIPFCPPDDPVFWYLNKKDSAAFYRHSISEAIVKLRQGFGRLLRSETDYGAMVIMDRRLHTKNYGKRIQDAVFPEDCWTSTRIEDIPHFFADFSD